MSVSLRIGFLAAFAMLLFGNLADAAVIDYIFTGTCTSGCSLHGTPFTTFTVTEVGDTTAVSGPSGGEFTNATTGTFVSGALTATLTGINEVIDLTTTPFTVGFGQIILSPFTVSAEAIANSSVFDTYDLKSALSLTTGTIQTPTTAAFFVTGDTTVGSLDFGTISTMTFQAVIPSAVPEPASLVILGSALAGFGLVRRRRKQV